MPDRHVLRRLRHRGRALADRVSRTADQVITRLGLAHRPDLTSESSIDPRWPLQCAFAPLWLFTMLHAVGWPAAAQWVLFAMVVVGTLAVAHELLIAISEQRAAHVPVAAGFSDDPDELEAQLAELRPAVLRLPAEPTEYARCCRSLGFDPLAADVEAPAVREFVLAGVPR